MLIPGEPPHSPTAGLSHTRILGEIIERELGDLRRGVEVLVWRMGLAQGKETVGAVADDVLQDVVLRALARASTFDQTRSAHAWLYGIAVNVMRERRRRDLAENRRSVPLVGEDQEGRHDADLGERAYRLAISTPKDALVELLDLVAPSDREVLRWAFVEQLRGPDLAVALGVKAGAARVRLSRALRRLSAAYREAEQAGEHR